VITEYPRTAILRARHDQSAADHTLVPTTMYLLVDHPQPMALSHATKLSPAANPNPQQFVAAYDVESQTLAVSPQRLLGRRSIPESWTAAQRAHYLALPDDPRYAALADIIARDVDPRFAGDDLARAWAIKRYLEREGFYTMKSKHTSSSDPTGSFLFGSLRGYCVHFAHAAVYLLRSQGIAARVALGYAVQTTKRSGGSSLLIMSDRAHAWPEIHLDGIGWVTFDVYPERTDVSPPTPVDYDLEKLLGELARNDKTAGVTPEGTPLRIPWRAIALALALLALAAVLGAYLTKIYRRLSPSLARGEGRARRAYRAVLDRLSDLGRPRLPGETRERHAARLQSVCPHLAELTQLHLASAFGGRRADPAEVARLVDAVRVDLRTHVPALRRALGLLNPVGWLRTR
jgi:protein-glutamine gamma-glutamyltransferase